MKFLILLLLAVPALAGTPTGGAFATVTFVSGIGTVWIDSGIVRRVHEEPSPVPGYSLLTVEFTDHADQYHLDEGTVDIVWR